MAKLPGIADLGAIPAADVSRPVGSYDVSAYARGAQQIAQGVQALGKGVGQFGEGVEQLAIDKNRWEYSKAHADFQAKKIDLDTQTQDDTNYGPDELGRTLPQRYNDSINWQQKQSANLISDPAMRERFTFETAPMVHQGMSVATQHARRLSNDADTAYVDQMSNRFIDQAVGAKDDATRTQIIDTHNQLVDGLVAKGAITNVQAVQMKQNWAHQYATADLLARSDQDPQGVINELRAAPGSGEEIDNRIIQIEGKGKNPRSSAQGVGQWIDSTWLDMIKRNRPDLAQGRSDQQILALRADEGLGRQMTTAYRKENTAALAKQGIETTPGNIYLAHFLGAGGAAAVLKANPNMPVEEALAKSLGPDKAKAMVDANPTVLRGQLVGSVKNWAEGKMGGAVPGGGSVYDMLRPDVREQILAHAQTQLQKQNVQDLTGFKQQMQDEQAEVDRTGNVKNPMPLSSFVSSLGADLGPKVYEQHQANVQVSKDAQRVATMDPEQMQELYNSYEPKSGQEGYAEAGKRQDIVGKAIQRSMQDRQKDPAGFAVTRLPGTQEAYQQYQAAASDPNVDPAQRGVAARSFAATTLLEQQGAGIPPGQRQILPAADVEHFKTMVTNAATSDDPKARVGVIGQIQAQKAMWGDYWPDVVRQLTPTMQPMVRAIAAGADTNAMSRLLSLDPKENPKAILKEQDETRAGDLTKGLNAAMAPLKSTMVGNQIDRDYFDYYNMAEKLGALYARDGKDGTTAASDAYNALIGNRYDIMETYRVPKDSGVPIGDVQAGADAARRQLDQLGAVVPRNNLPGRSNPTEQDMRIIARDGRWVTSPDNGGLNLMYGDAPVKDGKGQPLFLSWGRLAQIGGTPEAREQNMKAATEFGTVSP